MPFDKGKKRRLIDNCGHERCYSCMFTNESCPVCSSDGPVIQHGKVSSGGSNLQFGLAHKFTFCSRSSKSPGMCLLAKQKILSFLFFSVIALFCSISLHVALFHFTLLYFTSRCSISLHVALFHFTLLYFTFRCSILLHFSLVLFFFHITLVHFAFRCFILLHDSLFYFTLLYFTSRCSISLHVAVFCFPFIYFSFRCCSLHFTLVFFTSC
jgi:hypothetical protein